MWLRFWRLHSLSIVSGGVGAALWIGSLFFPEGKTFDCLNGLGNSALAIAFFYALSGPLREVNKPEE